jgi:hypothetical protein
MPTAHASFNCFKIKNMKKNKIEIYKAFVGLSAFSSNGLSLVISNSSLSLY